MSTSKKSIYTRRNFIKNSTVVAASTAFVTSVKPVYLNAGERNEPPGWFENVYRQLHIDAHFGGFKEIYKNFDAEAAAQIFEEAGVQMVSYFAKCWAGYSYYPTNIGVEHPGLERDFTGELTRALKKRNIRTIIYFMLGVERKHQKEHPDWVRNTDPKVTIPEAASIGDSPIMCFRSPYVDLVGIPQMKEIVSKYDCDGFFVDIVMQQFLQWNCYCKYCRGSFDREVGGAIPTKPDDPKAFSYRKWSNRHMEAHMEKVQRELEKVKPDITIINNYAWMMRYPVNPPQYVHHVCWDTPVPTEGLFAWNFSLEARYLATLPGVTWSCMNTRGNTWGEYSLREPEAFMQECALLLAACGRTYLSDIPYPFGNPDSAVMTVFGKVNKRTKELEPYLKGCTPVKDTAVLHTGNSIWSKAPLKPTPTWTPGPAYHSVCGAHKALIEGHVQIGILNSQVFLETIGDYKALILPDQRILSNKECEAVRKFVRNGGMLLATCETSTRDTDNNLMDNFKLADVFGVDYAGTSDTTNCYLRFPSVNKKYGIPAMDIQVGSKYVKIKPTTAKILLELVPPYEGIKTGTPPPALDPEGPGVTVNSYGNGKAIYCAPQLFDAYYRIDTPVMRKLALWMLDQVYPSQKRTIAVKNTPINVEVFYNQRGQERFIHLVNYSGDKREVGVPQTQDFPVIHGIKVRAKVGKKPSQVRTIPEEKSINFTYNKGLITFVAEPLEIHSIYMIV